MEEHGIPSQVYGHLVWNLLFNNIIITMKVFHIFTLVIAILLTTSCNKSFLDVSDELAEERDFEKLFSTPADVRRWHRHIFSGVPNPAQYDDHSSFTGLHNPWNRMTDELKIRRSIEFNLSPYNVSHTRFARWQLYRLIRQANIFLENAKEIPRGDGPADFIGKEELDELMAQARFFRAYYHYLLFELYGPIPIMDFAASPAEMDLDFPRNSVDEVVRFIYNELTAVANHLKDPDLDNQEQLAVPTKGTALAVRGRLMIYAASPLFNGGYQEALSLSNPDGKRLFPDADANKWQLALDALQEFIDYAESGHYELHKEYTDDGVFDPHKSIYEVFMKYNKEIIFARSNVDWDPVDKRARPRAVRGAVSSTGVYHVLQELVDDYFMIDGLSIRESPLYSENGLSDEGDDISGQTEPGAFRMYINREPRFYQMVFYNGRKWHVGNEQIWFQKGGNSDNSVTDEALTGYTAYKYVSRRVYEEGSHPRTVYRPAMIHRLAEFYLLYAEALNEVDPLDARIIQYVDKVRDRAGIPRLIDIKPEIIGNQELQRQAIRAEMRVELAMEGQRYFDVRRWMIAENEPGKGGQGGTFHGMNPNASDLLEFYTRTRLEDRAFTKAMYLYPIPFEEIQKSNVLVQNPLY